MKFLLNIFILLTLLIPLQSIADRQQSTDSTVHRSAASIEEQVYFNTNSKKFHKSNCTSAIRCTRNCISIPRSEAIERGGRPCKVCGG